MCFFDQYPDFYQTSQTSPQPTRLNARYQSIIAKHKNRFQGKRVLDIGSHDGRWSFAAIQAGASYVEGIEAREHLIDHANRTFETYRVEPDRYLFKCGDAFEALSQDSYDIVLCLGFFYHTVRHIELLDKIEKTGAKLVILDTEVTPLTEEKKLIATEEVKTTRAIYDNPYYIQLIIDPVQDEKMTFAEPTTRKGLSLVGRPSRGAIQLMAEHFGFRVDSFNWEDYFKNNSQPNEPIRDYLSRWRETFYLERT